MIRKGKINVDGKKVLITLVLCEHLFYYYFNNILNKDLLIDPITYYTASLKFNSMSEVLKLLYPGSKFMLFVTVLFTKIYQSFALVSLLLSLFCFIPYYSIITRYYKPVFESKGVFWKITFLLVIFMPSIHIWTTSIYKETLIFPLMYLLLQKINQPRENTIEWDIIIYLVLLFFLRPYLVGIFILSWLVTSYKYLNKKIIISAIVSSIALFSIFWYLFLPNLTIFSINDKLKEINDFSKVQGSSVIDLETVSYVERLFYMLFRPLFFDVHNKFQFFYSFENLCLIGWFLLFLYLVIKKSTVKIKYLMQSVFIMTSVFIWLFISVYIYNYGLASRMKVMIVPFFLIGILDILKNKVSEKNY